MSDIGPEHLTSSSLGMGEFVGRASYYFFNTKIIEVAADCLNDLQYRAEQADFMTPRYEPTCTEVPESTFIMRLVHRHNLKKEPGDLEIVFGYATMFLFDWLAAEDALELGPAMAWAEAFEKHRPESQPDWVRMQDGSGPHLRMARQLYGLPPS